MGRLGWVGRLGWAVEVDGRPEAGGGLYLLIGLFGVDIALDKLPVSDGKGVLTSYSKYMLL